MASKIDRFLAPVLMVCAAVMAASMVYRALAAGSTGSQATPTRISTELWEEAVALGHVVGEPSAKVVIVEVVDLQCPSCRTFHNTLQRLSMGGAASFAVVHIPYPLAYHEFALPAARAAECAASTGHFSAFISAVFAKQDSLGTRGWGAYAVDAAMPDTLQLVQCALDTVVVSRITQAKALAEKIGITGTPTVIINGWKLPTTPSAERLAAIIEDIESGENPFARRRWRGEPSVVLAR